MIGHDNAIPNYVHAARASWLYLHENSMQTPNQTPPSSDYRKRGCGNNKFMGRSGDQVLTGQFNAGAPYKACRHAEQGTSLFLFVDRSIFNLHNSDILPMSRLTTH